MPTTAREMVKLIKKDGWIKVASKGHQQYTHPTKPGRVTIPMHRGDLPIKTERSIRNQAGL